MRPIDFEESSWQELYEAAAKRVSQLLPGWSDTYPSDPAVALLELFSALSHAQNLNLGRLGGSDYQAFVRLLGGEPQKRLPASFLAKPALRRGLYPDRRFFIGGIPFEVAGAYQPGENRVLEAALTLSGERRVLAEGAPLALEGGAELTIAFSASLTGGVPARLWCELLPEPGRVPPDDETQPPVSLCASAQQGDQWREAEVLDGTRGFLQSGFLTVTPTEDTACLRLSIQGEVEGVPRMAALVWEPVLLEQRRTRSGWAELLPPFRLPEGWAGDRVLRFFVPEKNGWREAPPLTVEDGLVSGWPDGPPPVLRVAAAEPDFAALHPLQGIAQEEVPLEEGVLADSLYLMAEEEGRWFDCPVGPPSDVSTLPRGCRWDEAEGVLRFGDGRDYDVPSPGRLLVLGCALTLGSAGNGAGGLLGEGERLLHSLYNARGGRNAEDAKAAFLRVSAQREEPLRAVTCADYEALARRTPGLALERVRALPGNRLGRPGPGVTVLAKPRSSRPLPDLTAWQRQRLLQWLESFRLIGVPLRVEGPRYIPLEIRVSLTAIAPVPEETLHAVALEMADGVAGPLDFGAGVSYSALFSALGAVPDVRAVRSLELRPLSGGAKRTQDGSLSLEPDALPYIRRFAVTQ